MEAGQFLRVREGRVATIVAGGPVLDRVLAATAGLDVTVLYAATVRPFDIEALLTGPCEQVVLVEPYLSGTSAVVVNDALSHLPHRLLSLGVGKTEVRRYGTTEQHDRAHGLDATALRGSIASWLTLRGSGHVRLSS